MDVRALTVNAVRDGPVCTVILCGPGDAQMGYGMGELVTRNWPPRIRAPRSSPRPRDARDQRVQRTQLPVPGVIDTPTASLGEDTHISIRIRAQ